MTFVKDFKKQLTENLFKVQDPQELNDPKKVPSTWEKHLYELVDRVNNTETQMNGMKLKGVVKLKEVPLVESYPPEDMLPEDRLYHYLLQPSKEHDDQCKRAMDRTWSKGTYRLS